MKVTQIVLLSILATGSALAADEADAVPHCQRREKGRQCGSVCRTDEIDRGAQSVVIGDESARVR